MLLLGMEPRFLDRSVRSLVYRVLNMGRNTESVEMHIVLRSYCEKMERYAARCVMF